MSILQKILDNLIAYEHAPTNVVYLNTSHARANAAQVALLLEEDRSNMERDQRLVCDLWGEKRRLEARLTEIVEMLEVLTRG